MFKDKKLSVIIVAGGKGLRAGGEMPKQFQEIAGKPMLMHTIEAFYYFNYDIKIVVVVAKQLHDFWRQLCKKHNFEISHILEDAGDTRFHSVKNGLSQISDNEIVGIHDAARPFIKSEVIERCYLQAYEYKCGVVPVVEEKNSVRLIINNGNKHLDRKNIRIVQTPQVFPSHIIKNSYSIEYNTTFTDDASVAEKNGVSIKLVDGDENNIKITTPIEMTIAQLLMKKYKNT